MSVRGRHPAIPSPEPELLHVFDLPQIYQKPSAKDLQDALDLLAVGTTFGTSTTKQSPKTCVDSTGVPKYITSIISSPLQWLNEADQETIWSLASIRLSERSGRTAMGNLTRTFDIPTSLTSTATTSLVLHEPAMTEDNLGLKTWSSSHVLAKLLASLRPAIIDRSSPVSFVLELGAGTGLVGLAAACAWSAKVILTDLPIIEPNLAGNIVLNADVVSAHGGEAESGVLDWANPQELCLRDGAVTMKLEDGRAGVILAADSVYSMQHVELLTRTIDAWLERSADAVVVLAHPQREGYAGHFVDLRSAMKRLGLVVVNEGLETTQDDWEDEVVVVWMVWMWAEG